MAARAEIRQFLASRRARVTPASVGLPDDGRRRVPGLRREEVAALAGVSIDYYVRLERGDANGPSDAVLDGVARALRLDAAEHAHLRDLLRRRPSVAASAPASPPRASASLQRVLDAMTEVPAFVSDARFDLVALNPLCAALYSDLLQRDEPVNLARFTFLDPRARAFYPEWELVADLTVALIRASAGRNPDDARLRALVGLLAIRSEEFRQRWAAHHVQHHTSGRKRLHHRVVGDLDLSFDSLDLAVDPDLTLTVYTAEPGSATEEALRLLGSWQATATATATADRDRDHEPVLPR